MGAVMDLLKSTCDIHSTWPQSKRPQALYNSCIRRACAGNHVCGATDWNCITRTQGVIQEKAVSSDSKYGTFGKAQKIGLLNFIDLQCQEKERFSNMAGEIVKRLLLAGSGIFSSETPLKELIHSSKVKSSREAGSLTDLADSVHETYCISCEEKQNKWVPDYFQKYLKHPFSYFVTVNSPAKRMKMANGSYCSPLITNRCLYSMFTSADHQGIVNPVTQDENISNLFLGLNLASELVSPNSDKTDKTLRNGLQSKARKPVENGLGNSKRVPSSAGAKSPVCRRILFTAYNEQGERPCTSDTSANVLFPENSFMSNCKPSEEMKSSDVSAEKNVDKNCRRKKARPSSKKRRRHKQKQTNVAVTEGTCNGIGQGDELDNFRDNIKVESLPAWNAQGINHLSRTKRRCRKTKSPCQTVKSVFTCSPTKNNTHLAFIFTVDTDSDASDISMDSANEELWDSFQFHSDRYNPMNFGSAEVFKSSSIPAMSTRLDDSPRRWSWSPSSRKDYIPSSKKVHFAREESLVTEHSCISLDEERKGPWEELARDRCRFERRIEAVENAIGYCLQTDHRHKILCRFNHTESESD